MISDLFRICVKEKEIIIDFEFACEVGDGISHEGELACRDYSLERETVFLFRFLFHHLEKLAQMQMRKTRLGKDAQ